MKTPGIYVHVPYCKSKCKYCDFFSGGAAAAPWERLADAYACELRERRSELQRLPDTLYIGGGTPSLIPAEVFVSLVGKIKEIAGVETWREFTIEVNPDDVSAEKCQAWASAGVNRVSIGVQSFSDTELQAIGRRHDASAAERAFLMLGNYFGNITLDLMFGLPGQTLQSWRETVEKALALKPQHISAYSLMFEEGTVMSVLRDQKRMTFPSEEECVAMWEELSSMLTDAGFTQYEVSNYSLPGMESVHNSKYWHGAPYVGLGPSAHSFDGCRTRSWNPADIKGYLARYSTSDAALSFPYNRGEEILTGEEIVEERVMTGMRTSRGIDLVSFRAEFGDIQTERLLRNAKDYEKNNKVEIAGGYLRLTKKGIMTLDDVVVALIM